MNKYNLIDIFFENQEEYIKFLVGLKVKAMANSEGTCMAELTKTNDCFLYKLIWIENGKFLGDYITPFKASQENIDIFNQGCKIIAERLSIYIETNDVNKVPVEPPAFADLTAEQNN